MHAPRTLTIQYFSLILSLSGLRRDLQDVSELVNSSQGDVAGAKWGLGLLRKIERFMTPSCEKVLQVQNLILFSSQLSAHHVSTTTQPESHRATLTTP